MKALIDPGLRAIELARWQGTWAAIWMFHVTLKRLALRLSRPDGPEVLYLVAVGCEHMTGPFSWNLAELTLEEGQGEARIVDRKAGFELRCSSVTLAKGPSTELDTSFEGFMGESVE